MVVTRAACVWGWVLGLVVTCLVSHVNLVRLSTPNGTVIVQESEDFLNWPRLHSAGSLVSSLIGRDGNATNHLQLLLRDERKLYFGSKNVLYIVDLDMPNRLTEISWNSSQLDLLKCQARQSSPDTCHNYIRVAAETSQDDLLLCGTNSLKPLCRIYSKGIDGYTMTSEHVGIGKCPYYPSHSSVAMHAGGRLYSATVADAASRDALLYSQPMRTEQHDSQWLNDPNFIRFDEYGDKIYLFFREPAVENINCKKVVFSRVARVCKNDEGGSRVLRSTWTSYFKARLNCSIPGEFPFYFDEMQSMSEIGDGNVIPSVGSTERHKIVYGVFSTAKNSLQGVAVCAFKMDDIEAVFGGAFKEQKTSHSSWLPVKESDTPQPHPAKSCANNSLGISDQTLNFIKSHPLMDKSVSALTGRPLFVLSTFKFTFVSIAVDWQVPAADGRYYDVIFLGTDDGRMIKYVNIQKSGGMEAVVISDMQIFASKMPVTKLSVHHDRGVVVAVSDSDVKSVPLQQCNMSLTCMSCVALRDPYCSWDDQAGCLRSSAGIQNIDSGHHSSCPVPRFTTTVVAASSNDVSTTSKSELNFCETCLSQCKGDTAPKDAASCDSQVVSGGIGAGVLVAAVLCTVIVTLVVGAALGYKLSLWRNQTSALQCKPENNKVKAASNTYEVDPPNHLRYSNSNKRNEDVPSSTIQPKEKQLNVDFKFNALGKTLNSNVETTIQPAKVKKVYI